MNDYKSVKKTIRGRLQGLERAFAKKGARVKQKMKFLRKKLSKNIRINHRQSDEKTKGLSSKF